MFLFYKMCSLASISMTSCIPCYAPLTTSYFTFSCLMPVHSGLLCDVVGPYHFFYFSKFYFGLSQIVLVKVLTLTLAPKKTFQKCVSTAITLYYVNIHQSMHKYLHVSLMSLFQGQGRISEEQKVSMGCQKLQAD